MNDRGASLGIPPGRLAIVTGSGLIGGHEMQLAHLARAIASDRPVVIVVTSGVAERFFAERGFAVRHVPFARPGKIWRQWAAARSLSAALGPAIADADAFLVSGGTIEACVAPARAIRLLRPGATVTAYMPMDVDRALLFGLTGRIYNHASRLFVRAIDRFVTVNRIQARLIGRRYGRPVGVFRNVIVPIAPPDVDRGPRLVSVGRLDDAQKNVTGLVALLDHPDNPFRTLDIFGDGPDRDEVAAAASAARHIEVTLHGWTPHDRLARELGRRDILVMNSRWEGEPLIVGELAAAGIPAIGTDIAGFRGLLPRRNRFGDQAALLAILARLHAARAAAGPAEVDRGMP